MSRPFDAARYARLLEGLNVGEEKWSLMSLRARIDAENAAHPRREWLAQLVSKKEFVPLASVLNFAGSGHTPYKHDVSEGDVGFVTVECVGPLQFLPELTKRITRRHYDSEFENNRVRKGDVLCTIKRRICQAVAFVRSPDEPLAINQDIALLRPSSPVRPAYLAAYLSCAVGQTFADRQKTEQMNPYISVENLRTLPFHVASPAFQDAITTVVELADVEKRSQLASVHEAETALTAALNLDDWHPPEPLTYTRRASEAFAARRLDAQYFAPRVAELLARLGAGGRTVRDAAPQREEKFSPGASGTFRYIEISDVRSDGTVTDETLPMREAPSRATWHVKAGDVLTSTVRPNRRLSAIVAPEQDGCVASSGFAVLQPKGVPAEVLLTYLRLPLFCELMDLHTSASLYPAISERDLLALPFPEIPAAASEAIVAAVQSAHTARTRARALLAAAQRAVEIAIEQSESAALDFLNNPRLSQPPSAN